MGDQFPQVKAAAVHSASVFLDREGSVDKACRLIGEAGAAGAGLVVFPETFIPGYPFWIWTHTPTTGAPLFHEFFANSVVIPSEATEQLCAAARAAGAYVVMGISERDGGTLYNTLLYIDKEGCIMGRHRKLQPTHVERTVWGRGDGSDILVFDTPFGRLGGLICWEHSMDLVRYALTARGEQIHAAVWPGGSALTHNPHASFFDSMTEAAAKHHAFAGQTFVISVQSRLDEAAIERMGLAGQPDMMRPGGGWSAIVGPEGKIIAGPHTDDEAILYADLDLAEIVYAKYACDSAGHYARPDVVRLWENTAPQPVVMGDESGSSGRGPPFPKSDLADDEGPEDEVVSD